MKVQDEIEEHMELVAATAIEDKLQDQVGKHKHFFSLKLLLKYLLRFHNQKSKASRNKNMGIDGRQNRNSYQHWLFMSINN